YPVIRPYPARPQWSMWLLLPLLLIADLSNTALSALLTFSDKVLYPYYAEVPRIGSLSALGDQAIAGVIMWVPCSLVFLVPLVAIGVRVLFGDATVASRNSKTGAYWLPTKGVARVPKLISLPIVNSGQPSRRTSRSSGFDLLSLPILGRCLKWRY